MNNKLSVCIVTWNSEKYIEQCVDSLYNQSYLDFELIVVDNASTDRTRENILKLQKKYAFQLLLQEYNTGFCGGHNVGIRVAKGKYYMPLNPDVLLTRDYIETLIKWIEKEKKVGSATGKLLRMNPETKEATGIVDSTGIRFLKNRRSIDRDSGMRDKETKIEAEYVFGASGAVPMYKMEMLQDVLIGEEVFFENFFAYREDVDLAWRAQLRGWKCIYAAKAYAYHVRYNLPERRKEMSPAINMHSVKNRMIMLYQNVTLKEFLLTGYRFLYYDVMILAYVCLKERTSLQALKIIWKERKKIRDRRQLIQTNKKVSYGYLKRWFGEIDSLPMRMENENEKKKNRLE